MSTLVRLIQREKFLNLKIIQQKKIIQDLERETTELKQRLNLALDPHAELEILESE